MAVSVTRKIFVIFRKWLLEMVNQRICSVFFFGVFCADLLAVDTGNAFCRLLGRGLFVILFSRKAKTSEDLGRTAGDKLSAGSQT